MTQKTAIMLLIGNELLSGRTQDKNLQFTAKTLASIGIDMLEARVIPDIKQTIIDNILHASKNFDYVFTSGGIGPTHDDITSASVAEAFGRKLICHLKALEILKAHYARSNEELNDARRKMAHVPEGARLIANPVSGAPGFVIENVYVMAGVPRIMNAMLENILPTLGSGDKNYAYTIINNLREGTIADDLGKIEQSYDGISIGSYPFYNDGDFGVSLVIRSKDTDILSKAINKLREMIASHNGKIITEQDGEE